LVISNIIATFATSPERIRALLGSNPEAIGGAAHHVYDEKIGWGLAPSDF